MATSTTPSPSIRFWGHPHAVTSTTNGLLDALNGIADHGWDSPDGEAVLGALGERSRSWAAMVDRRCGRPAGTTSPADVLSTAWCTLTRFAPNIVAAEAPWAYLWTAVGNALAVDIVADSMLSERGPRRSPAAQPSYVVRLGLGVDAAPEPTAPADPPSRQPSPAVATLIQWLADDSHEAREFWADAIDRSLEVMAGARRSYEEHTLRRDAYLRNQLHLSLDELSALAALLIGPRRGDRASQSALLALHRDPATPIEAVRGASARVQLLRAHRHASDAVRRDTAAA